ncbi:MAG: hypothetical protein [Bacteriophage sp.]|nr:MAG: hypothetical protein [Bacteriophage sp.]
MSTNRASSVEPDAELTPQQKAAATRARNKALKEAGESV